MQPTTTQYKPDELVTIVNNKNKQVKQVKRAELPQYGLPVDYISQADTYANSVKAGITNPDAVPEAYRAGAMQALNSTGYTPKTQIERDIENAKLKAKPDAEALHGGIQNLKQQAKDATIGTGILSKLTGGNLGTETDVFDQSKKLLGQAIARLFEKGVLSDKDRDFYQKQILDVGAVGTTTAINKKLDNIETEILRKTGYKPSDFGGKTDNKKKSGEKGIGQRLAEGAVRDVNELGQGIIETGKAAIEGKLGNTPAQMIGNTAVNMGKGIFEQAKQAAPIRMDENGQPVFDIGKTGNYIVDNPVDTAMAVLPFTKFAKAGIAGKAAKGTEAVAGGAEASRFGAIKGGISSKVSGAVKATKNMASEAGVSAFANNFTIPSRLAPRIKIDKVARTMIENGHSGDLNQLGAIADKVTGSNGIFPKLNREVIGMIKEPIKMDTAISSGTNAINKIPQLTTREAAAHGKIIRDMITGGENGALPGETGAFDALDAVQTLEKEGYKYINSSTKLTPNIVNEKIGQAYLDAADELEIQLNQYSSQNIDALKTPENIAAIDAISPKLGEQFRQAKNMADLRKLQSPYVRLNQAIALTQDAAHTPFSQMSSGIARTVGAGLGGTLGTIISPGVGTAIGGVAGAFAEPFIRPIVEATLPKMTTKVAQILKK